MEYILKSYTIQRAVIQLTFFVLSSVLFYKLSIVLAAYMPEGPDALICQILSGVSVIISLLLSYVTIIKWKQRNRK